MSVGYAFGLSPYANKGRLGIPEEFDSPEDVDEKIKELAKMIEESAHAVVHTGAGISTSAGIPDFRGPNGVWTLEEMGIVPDIGTTFDDAIPTKTHMAIYQLVQSGKLDFVVSQNIDGLHMRSSIQRRRLAELHGNIYTGQCSQCHRQFVLNKAGISVGKRSLDELCPGLSQNGRPCRGKLHDTILDWEHSLPETDLELAEYYSGISDLSICLGTSLQIVPSANLPLLSKKNPNGKLVICNLQPTKYDDEADLIIRAYVDDVMCGLMKLMNLEIPLYNREMDPTVYSSPTAVTDWTILQEDVDTIKGNKKSQVKTTAAEGAGKKSRKRKSEEAKAEDTE